MANNAQKTPFQVSMNQFAAKKAANAIQNLGKSLPASVVSVDGSIVTVKFELTNTPFTLPNVTVPMFGPEYIRYPIRPGDKGTVVAVDARLGGQTGLGVGTASLAPAANLSTLFFMPLANKNWTVADSPDQVVIYGPDGALLRTIGGGSSLLVNNAGVQATAPTIGMTGEVIINGSPFALPGLLGLASPDNSSITSIGGVFSVNWGGGGGGPQPGNPTALAGPIAINGSGTQYMRANAAPAVQLGDDAQFGIVMGDGVTIRIIGGVATAIATSVNAWQPQGSWYLPLASPNNEVFALPTKVGYQIAAGMPGSIVEFEGPPAADWTANFLNGAVNIGSVTVPAGLTTGVITFPSTINFTGDLFKFVAPAVADGSAFGLSFLFIGTR
jgi:hypothetical protein